MAKIILDYEMKLEATFRSYRTVAVGLHVRVISVNMIEQTSAV